MSRGLFIKKGAVYKQALRSLYGGGGVGEGGAGGGGGGGGGGEVRQTSKTCRPPLPPPFPSPPALSPRTTADQSTIRPRPAQPFPIDTNPQVLSAGYKTFFNGGESGVNVIYPKTWLDKFMNRLAFAGNSACPFPNTYTGCLQTPGLVYKLVGCL